MKKYSKIKAVSTSGQAPKKRFRFANLFVRLYRTVFNPYIKTSLGRNENKFSLRSSLVLIKEILDKLADRIVSFIDWGGKKTEKLINYCEPYFMSLFKFLKRSSWKKLILLCIIAFFFLGGLIILWASTFALPNLDNFEERKVSQSTKIYDRTGDVILFDVHGEITRTVIPFDQMSDYVKWATIAIEDDNFYNHKGIEPKAILRAIFTNLKEGNLFGGQGGSTITQQVIKNALLTSDKKISRKVKEWVLAPRLEKLMTKDEILATYLNEVPYGGTVYGVQEASRRFFSKDAKDLTLVEAAYIAALPQAPTYYSPYGEHLEQLTNRKNIVLQKMLENNFISQSEYDSAKIEEVAFQKPENFGIKAPHFVMYVRALLEEKYGVEAVEQGGLKVVTSLDWELQEKAEEIVKKNALANKEKYDAENGSIVAVDPNTGQILVMVGSRDYFDEEIDGNFNIATAERQPGSSFKPFVYAEAFNKGYRPETVVFDLPTEFSATCSSGGNCYSPVNYDNVFRGPMSLRDALAQSVNIPAVKVLYLAGLKDSLNLAKKMGVETLTNVDQYGLTLVLGGGEVRPVDMASAYGVFASEGIKHSHTGILKVEDREGNVLEEYENQPERVLPQQTALLISDVLSDNVARTPAFGSNSYLNFPNKKVAVKTGTTNDYRDAWIVGYTTKISVAAWAGNNDNRSMDKKVAGFIVAPMWHEFMEVALSKEEYQGGSFNNPESQDSNVKPIIAGYWQGGSVVIDKTTGQSATKDTLEENKVTLSSGGGVHSILHYVNKNDPLGPAPKNPNSDPQYSMWESSVQAWSGKQNINFNSPSFGSIFQIISPENGKSYKEDGELFVAITTTQPISGSIVLLNGFEIGSISSTNLSFSFVPKDQSSIKNNNTLRVLVTDATGKEYDESVDFKIID